MLTVFFICSIPEFSKNLELPSLKCNQIKRSIRSRFKLAIEFLASDSFDRHKDLLLNPLPLLRNELNSLLEVDEKEFSGNEKIHRLEARLTALISLLVKHEDPDNITEVIEKRINSLVDLQKRRLAKTGEISTEDKRLIEFYCNIVKLLLIVMKLGKNDSRKFKLLENYAEKIIGEQKIPVLDVFMTTYMSKKLVFSSPITNQVLKMSMDDLNAVSRLNALACQRTKTNIGQGVATIIINNFQIFSRLSGELLRLFGHFKEYLEKSVLAAGNDFETQQLILFQIFELEVPLIDNNFHEAFDELIKKMALESTDMNFKVWAIFLRIDNAFMAKKSNLMAGIEILPELKVPILELGRDHRYNYVINFLLFIMKNVDHDGTINLRREDFESGYEGIADGLTLSSGNLSFMNENIVKVDSYRQVLEEFLYIFRENRPIDYSRLI
jgi:hypothetical protein